jgi:hypothetical protein
MKYSLQDFHMLCLTAKAFLGTAGCKPRSLPSKDPQCVKTWFNVILAVCYMVQP